MYQQPLSLVLNINIQPPMPLMERVAQEKPKPKRKKPKDSYEGREQNGNKSLRELINSGV